MSINMIIGDCGAGKSSLAYSFVLPLIKKNVPVFSNLYCDGAFRFDLNELMVYDFPENSVLILDESASFGLGSRGNLYKKNITDNIVEFFTMYRHYKIRDIYVISPSFDDVLPIIRDNATSIFCVKTSCLNKFHFNKYKMIKKRCDIIDGSIKMVYEWIPFSTRFKSRKKAYKIFDSFTRKELLSKDWVLWS